MRNVTCFAAALSAWLAIAPALAAEDGGAAAEPYTSTKDKGVVSIVPDPVLSDGRLLLKVVAFNRTKEPVSFGSNDVRIFTAAGATVPLLSLEHLIEEAKAGSASSAATRSMDTAYQPSTYGRRSMPRTGTGEIDVSGAAGADDVFNRQMSARATARATPGSSDEELQQQIASLKAGILQPQSIAPATAAGGQVVTDKLKFSRKQERALRVVVDFNGEQHEFNFPAPPAR